MLTISTCKTLERERTSIITFIYKCFFWLHNLWFSLREDFDFLQSLPFVIIETNSRKMWVPGLLKITFSIMRIIIRIIYLKDFYRNQFWSFLSNIIIRLSSPLLPHCHFQSWISFDWTDWQHKLSLSPQSAHCLQISLNSGAACWLTIQLDTIYQLSSQIKDWLSGGMFSAIANFLPSLSNYKSECSVLL